MIETDRKNTRSTLIKRIHDQLWPESHKGENKRNKAAKLQRKRTPPHNQLCNELCRRKHDQRWSKEDQSDITSDPEEIVNSDNDEIKRNKAANKHYQHDHKETNTIRMKCDRNGMSDWDDNKMMNDPVKRSKQMEEDGAEWRFYEMLITTKKRKQDETKFNQ